VLINIFDRPFTPPRTSRKQGRFAAEKVIQR
jgi:hypothetical protein